MSKAEKLLSVAHGDVMMNNSYARTYYTSRETFYNGNNGFKKGAKNPLHIIRDATYFKGTAEVTCSQLMPKCPQ